MWDYSKSTRLRKAEIKPLFGEGYAWSEGSPRLPQHWDDYWSELSRSFAV